MTATIILFCLGTLAGEWATQPSIRNWKLMTWCKCHFLISFHPVTWNYLVDITLSRFRILVSARCQNLFKNCPPSLHHNKNHNIKAPPLISSVDLLQVKPPFVSKVTKRNSMPACFWLYKWKLTKWWMYVPCKLNVCQKLIIVSSRMEKNI